MEKILFCLFKVFENHLIKYQAEKGRICIACVNIMKKYSILMNLAFCY